MAGSSLCARKNMASSSCPKQSSKILSEKLFLFYVRPEPVLAHHHVCPEPVLASRRISFKFLSDSSKKYVPCSLRLPVGLPHRFRGHVGLVSYRFRGKGKKTGFLSHLYIKILFLPRQARDKHRGKLKKSPFSRRYFTSSRRRKEISGA
jgi:hypothetical protein